MAISTKHRTIIGVFRSRLADDACYSALLRRGYLSSDISIVLTDRTRSRDYAWAPTS